MSMDLMDFVKDAKSRIKEVDVSDAEQLLSSGEYRVLDVREPAEYAAGTVGTNAVHVPRGMIEAAADLNYPGATPALRDNRDAKWLILCRSGGRAALAADTLQKMGFTDVTNIIGGIDAWTQAGKSIDVPKQ